MAIKSIIASLLLGAASLFAQAPQSIPNPPEFIGSVYCKGTCYFGQLTGGAFLTSIEVTPTNPTGQVGGDNIVFAANGTFSDGSHADVTQASTWAALTPSVASNSGSAFTCLTGGVTTVQATDGAIIGTTTLTCQALQISPAGTLLASEGQLFSQIFTATGGTPPYTFSGSNLPGWLNLVTQGCGSNLFCDLTGTPPGTGTFNFSISAVDSRGVSATVAIVLEVNPVSSEDNQYCTPGAGVFAERGLFHDNAGPKLGAAAFPIKCVYDAVSVTPINPGGTIRYACPSGQLNPDLTHVAGCQAGKPPYYNHIQDAIQASTCGDWIQIYAQNWTAPGVTVQNVYNEELAIVGPNGTTAITCGPNDPSGHGYWLWITSKEINDPNFPAPGTRITPGWIGQSSLPGRPAYANPPQDPNHPSNIYLPLIMPTGCTPGAAGCQDLNVGSDIHGNTVPGVSGIRFIGLEFAAEKRFSTALAAGTGPGFNPPLINLSCSGSCSNIGWSDIIFDRLIVHACNLNLAGQTSKDDTGCTDQVPFGFTIQDGNYGAIINSFIYGLKTLGDIGGQLSPTDESHAISFGNVQTNVLDGPLKVVNNFLEAAAVTWFGGGSTSNPTCSDSPDGCYAVDSEFRRNHHFKPINWLVNAQCPIDPATGKPQSYCIGFQGGRLFDAFVSNGGGTGYDSQNAVCLVDPSPSGNSQDNAACGITISGGIVSSVYVVAPGKNYVKAQMHLTACRYFVNGVCLTPPPIGYSINTSGGTIPSDTPVYIGMSFTSGSRGFETDFQFVTVTTAGCTGGGCSITLTAPSFPSGYPNFNVYSCQVPSGKKQCDLQLNASGLTTNYNLTALGAGAKRPDANLTGEDGIYIVKNLGELKNAVRFLDEANVSENNNIGQSDQFGRCRIYGPRNANSVCPQCTVRDVIMRYDVCKNTVAGVGTGADPATQCKTGNGVCLPGQDGPIVLQDDVLELNGSYWIKDPSLLNPASGNGIKISNNNLPAATGQPCGNGICPTTSVQANHITILHAEPTILPGGQSISFGNGLNLVPKCNGGGFSNAVWDGMRLENSIMAGGPENTFTGASSGCFPCSTNGCGALNALNAIETNAFLGTPTTNYPLNIVVGIYIVDSGNCPSHDLSTPDGHIIDNGGTGSGGTFVFTVDKTKTHLATIAPITFGQFYTGPAVPNWSGCSGGTLPTVVVLLGGGANQPTGYPGNSSPDGSWCFDHNVNLQNGWTGEQGNDMPIQGITTQGDPLHNSCHGLGGNMDVTDPQGQSPTHSPWSMLGFNHLVIDGAGAEVPGSDLSLGPNSPYRNAGNGYHPNDSGPHANDLGADLDMITSKTGCFIDPNSDTLQCP